MRSKALFSMLVIASMVGACASFEPSSAAIPEKSDFRLIETDGILAGAVPYRDAEQQKALFDADLNAADVLAIALVVENQRGEAVLFRPTDAFLKLPGGRRIAPSSVRKVVNKVGEDGDVMGAWFTFGYMGLLAAQGAEDNARAARIDDYESKSLHTTELKPGGSANGFLFFLPPKSSPGFDSAELSVRFIDPASAQDWTVLIPLEGLKFVPAS